MTFGYKYPSKRFFAKPNVGRFRVKSPVRSFRDLEVYKATTQLAAEIYKIKLPRGNTQFKDELGILKNLSKQIPRLIAESYGSKFTSLAVSLLQLEQSVKYIANVVTKIDFLLSCLEDQQTKETLVKLLTKYQRQRIKILNLKKAWARVFSK